MDESFSSACRVFTVVHARWVAEQGKLRKTVAKIGHVVWNEDGTECSIYIPARLQHETLPGVVESLSDYVGAELVLTSAETLPWVMTRPETLKLAPSDCVALELGKWSTGIGWGEPGRLLESDEVETAWRHILSQIGEDKARWHTYSPALPGFG
jgi:hypothetical protein